MFCFDALMLCNEQDQARGSRTSVLRFSHAGCVECGARHDGAGLTCVQVLILGGGPNRIGQGIEFDYCCCHASFSLRCAPLPPSTLLSAEAGYMRILSIPCQLESPRSVVTRLACRLALHA
jgi:hypothetical protein